MNEAFDYAKQKWDKHHKVPYFKVGDLVLVSTFNLNNIKGSKKLKDSYVGTFFIFALHGNNAVQVELSCELENKHPTFPVSLINPYQQADNELKVIKERRLRGKNQRKYLVQYRNPIHEDE
ncbi:hypothetical protein O181_058517 [Austropuccinia psidii MF-1]|uniref:Tf2-1-like SH3-like domain-containing protein n=1 Tax=Austropuccinia psidii MF-1 TaxID=1389203 RepID=A0A9Q3HWH8_9BASI|nr:hypothetical protein [Austropuccinia psidii MF-1]